jgi:dipeptidyl-peptidase-4
MIKKITVFIIICLTEFLFCKASKAQIFQDTSILKPLPRITGWADNSHYIVERWNSSTRKFDVNSVSIKTGKETIHQSSENTTVPTVSILNGDVYLNKSSGGKQQLTNTKAVEKLPSLSPDKKWVAFLRNNDLFTIELANGNETRYTEDGSETIMNGYASWVYYEEILKRNSQYRAFWWSPDSKFIAFYHFDDRSVPVFPLDNAMGQHGYTEQTRYPKAGDPNPKVKIGIVSVASSKVVWADFNEQTDQYFGKPFWRPDSGGLLVQWMPRRQNNLKLFDVDSKTGKANEIYNEKQDTWVDWIDRLYWMNNGFLMVRDFQGWEQIYYHSLDGKLQQKLTNGKNWQVQIERIDEKAQMLYYSSNAELSTRTDVYRVGLNGKGQKRLSFGPYSHDKVFLSPDAKHLITQYSNATTPTRIALVDIVTGNISPIADSKGKAFNQATLKKREIIWMQTKEGFRLPASITWPGKLVEGKKYPLVIRIYGGPKHQTVFDRWTSAPDSGQEDDQEIKVVFEHRGSGHCGKEGLNYMYGNLGKWEMEDYISWVRQLRENPYVDRDEILISGGSYGGYLTALALTYGAEYFRFGIADYPVTDWMLYDSHYTERYMGLPKDNPDGYKFGSVLNHVDQYQHYGPAMLLIQHGLMDDNVHIQNTYQLIDVLQKKNKSFDLMVYPNERHGWKGPKVPFTVAKRNSFEEKYLFNKN